MSTKREGNAHASTWTKTQGLFTQGMLHTIRKSGVCVIKKGENESKPWASGGYCVIISYRYEVIESS